MRKILMTMVAFAIIFNVLEVLAEENVILKQYNEIGMSEVFDDADESFAGFDSEKIISDLSKGETNFLDGLSDKIVDFVFLNFKSLIKTCTAILVVGYLISIIHTLSTSFSNAASQTAFLIGYCVFAGVLVSLFSHIIEPVKEALNMIVSMTNAAIPTLLTMLTFSGGVNTAAMLSSVMVTMINIMSAVIGKFLMSGTLASISLSVADRMSDKINITSGVKFLRQSLKWVLMFCMALYSGIYGVYGMTGVALDKRIAKATKFAVGSGIPVVGGVVSDSIEVIISTLSTVRSLSGVVGIIAICAIALFPLIKTAMVMWLLRLCAALLEPVSDKRIVLLTSDVAESMSFIFAILASVSLLLIGCVSIIIVCGNFIL